MSMKKTCPRGKILRSAYKTKKGTHVRAACTKDMGRPGKGVPVWRVQRGGLKPYKVVNPKTKDFFTPATRHHRLRKAYESVQADGRYTKKGLLIARLNALRNYFKNSRTTRGKAIHTAIGSDIRWAQRNL